jgi:hypothetical protein
MKFIVTDTLFKSIIEVYYNIVIQANMSIGYNYDNLLLKIS